MSKQAARTGFENDLTGTSHWSTSGLMPHPPSTAYNPSIMRAAGERIQKGFPVSMAPRPATVTPRASFAAQFGASPLLLRRRGELCL